MARLRPIIHGDRVVLTAPDGGPVCCLNLRDGSRVWSASRSDDDLYVAGVFDDKAGGDKVLIVGKTFCRALNLDKGEEAWARPIAAGTPSGMGAASGNLYLLPLRNGNVFRIDVSPPLFVDADHRPARRAARQPRLSRRRPLVAKSDGRHRLLAARQEAGAGGRAGGQESPRPRGADRPRPAALQQRRFRPRGPGLARRPGRRPSGRPGARTRERLLAVLKQLLQEDFTANEKYLGVYETLCRRPAPAGATPEQVQAYRAEQRRWRLNLFALTALGRQSQGRIDLALKAYRDLYDAAAPNELMAAPDDPAVRVRPDLWVQERIASLAGAATTPEQRKPFQERIDLDWRRQIGRRRRGVGPLRGPVRHDPRPTRGGRS